MKWVVWNVQLASPWIVQCGQRERAAAIVKRLLEEEVFDGLVFLEVFDGGSRKILERGLAERYPYVADMPRSWLTWVNGGVVVMSRWPLERVEWMHFADATGADQWAAKGAVLVSGLLPVSRRQPSSRPTRSREKRSRRWWVVATHVQAWPEHAAVRQRQVAELEEWIRERVPAGAACAVVGDWNGEPEEVVEYWRPGARAVEVPPGEARWSWDGHRNDMVGNDGSAEAGGCGEDYFCQVCWSRGPDVDPGWCATRCPKPPEGRREEVRCWCCGGHLMDYGLIPAGMARPKAWSMRVERWRSDEWLEFAVWRAGWVTRPVLRTRDLSDHFPSVITWVPA